MIGERMFPTKYGDLPLPEGGYGRDLRGRWWCRPPGESVRWPLDAKMLIEHADGTATVRGTLGGGLSLFTLINGVWNNLNGGHHDSHSAPTNQVSRRPHAW